MTQGSELSGRQKGNHLYLTTAMALLRGRCHTQELPSPCRELVTCHLRNGPSCTPLPIMDKIITKFNSRGSVIPKMLHPAQIQKKCHVYLPKAHISHPSTLPLLTVTLQPQGHSFWLHFTFHLLARTYNMEQEICHRGHIPVVT